MGKCNKVNSHRVSHPAICNESQTKKFGSRTPTSPKTYLKLHKSNLYPTFQREPSLSRELDMGKETNQIRTQDMTVLEWEFICPPTLKVLTQSFHLSTSK